MESVKGFTPECYTNTCHHRTQAGEPLIQKSLFETDDPNLHGFLWKNPQVGWPEIDSVTVTFHGARQSSELMTANMLMPHTALGVGSGVNLASIGITLPGHGYSSGTKGHIGDPDQLMDQILKLLVKINKETGQKMSAVCHSMSALIMCRIASNPEAKKILDDCVKHIVILSGFLHYGERVDKHSYLLPLIKAFNKFVSPKFPIMYPHDPSTRLALKTTHAPKSAAHHRISVGTFLQSLQLMENIYPKTMGKLKSGFTFLHAKEDSVACPKTVASLSKAIGNSSTLIKVWAEKKETQKEVSVYCQTYDNSWTENTSKRPAHKLIELEHKDYVTYAHDILKSAVGPLITKLLLDEILRETNQEQPVNKH